MARFDRSSLPQTLQTIWIAFGISLLILTVVAAVVLDHSMARLLSSDDSYAASFIASVAVAGLFMAGTLSGWWFRSNQIAWLTTGGLLCFFAASLWLSDLVHDFGEGDGIFGYLGIGILIGGLPGLIAFWLRNFYCRMAFSFVPHLAVALGYLIAYNSMAN